MIRSFGNRESQELFHRDTAGSLPGNIDREALRKLAYLDAARDLRDLTVPPSFRLSRLRGQPEDRYALHITADWYILFDCHRRDPLSEELSGIDRHRKST